MELRKLRCPDCDYWLGEAMIPLVALDIVAKSNDVTTDHPRQLRKCGGCGSVVVLVPPTHPACKQMLVDLQEKYESLKIPAQQS